MELTIIDIIQTLFKKFNGRYSIFIYTYMKICSTCKIEKDISEFTKNSKSKDGLKTNCIDCCKIYYENYRKRNIEKERQRISDYNNNKRVVDKDKLREYKKSYYIINKEEIERKKKEYTRKNKKELHKKRMSNTLRRLNENLGGIIRYSLKNKGFKKMSRTSQILGCSPMYLKSYLESKFEPWMSWENWGKYDGKINTSWDIDHIIPISSAKTEEDILNLNHYTNLQPLCSYINRFVKCDKIDYLK